jgi:NhaA family Na+:H+ antiporter
MAGHALEHWINDGLMAIFFLLIGLELKREVYVGELSSFSKALLPLIAALGGMLVPALIYLGFNAGLPTIAGVGIPMATDIAFALGILSLLGNRVPLALKVFLTALAVIDDLGAIVVIALFYTKSLSLIYLGASLGIFGVLLLLNKAGIKQLWIYLIAGLAMWYCMLHSGVHPTITGVLLAFAIPFSNGDTQSISHRLQHRLHKPVAFFILPLFALANTAITLQSDIFQSLMEWSSIGILAGLMIGKPIGITLFSFLAVALKWCKLPANVSVNKLLGAGMLGGIGFTMSIFITNLSFDDSLLIDQSKFAILIASAMASMCGLIYLRIVLK